MSTTPATPSTPVATAPAAPVAPAAVTRAPASRKVVAKKPAAKPAMSVDTNASAKSAPKAENRATKPAAKPLAKAFAQPDKPAKTEAAPKADKPAKPAKPAKVRKPKLVRDRFTVTADDYAALVALKQRAAKLAVPVKKNALLRAGIRLLTALSDTGFKAELGQLPPLKPTAEKKAGKN